MPRWLTVRPWGSSSSPAICLLRISKKPWWSTWHAQKSGVSDLVPPCCQHFGLCEFDSTYYFPSGLTQCLWWISLWFDSWICQHHHIHFHRDWRNVYGNLDVTSYTVAFDRYVSDSQLGLEPRRIDWTALAWYSSSKGFDFVSEVIWITVPDRTWARCHLI